jgi:hypothetical protein
MRDMKIEMVGEPVKANWVPDDQVLAQCSEAGLRIAEALASACACHAERPPG